MKVAAFLVFLSWIPVHATGPTLSARQVAQVLKEYSKVQTEEFRLFRSVCQGQIKELKATQSKQRKDFQKEEIRKRRDFFNKNKQGKDKRTYVKDMMARQKQFDRGLRDAYRLLDKSCKDKEIQFREEQQKKLNEFMEYLAAGERPPDPFWPEKGDKK